MSKQKKQKVVLASNNAGKIREFAQQLQAFNIELVPQSDFHIEEVAETGLSFVENAIIKARHAAKQSGLPALADDSGLVVEALVGAPGIYSARYAGEKATAKDNIAKLLQSLKAIPTDQRQAKFYCVLVLMHHALDPSPLICTGEWVGEILTNPRGEEGFGYDPIFYVPSEKKSAAELSLEIKNTISHRALALQTLKKQLASV